MSMTRETERKRERERERERERKGKRETVVKYFKALIALSTTNYIDCDYY